MRDSGGEGGGEGGGGKRGGIDGGVDGGVEKVALEGGEGRGDATEDGRLVDLIANPYPQYHHQRTQHPRKSSL